MKILTILSVLLFWMILFPACEEVELNPNSIEAFKIESDSISFAIIGDYGEAGEPELLVSELVRSWAPEFILTLGDNNYENGKLSTIKQNISNYYSDYIYNPDADEEFRCNGFAAEEKVNRFFPSLGNHDQDNPNNAQPYLSFFSLPNKETYYDFQWGSVHFFTINSGRNGEAKCCESEQAVWLKEQLANSTQPFKIVYFHHPPYSTSNHGNSENMQWAFEEWGATAVFSGHEHSYQRITKKSNPDFPYIVNGLGGRDKIYSCGVHPLNESLFDTFCYNENFGAIHATATNEKMTIRFYSIGNPDVPVDEFVIEL